VAVTVAVAIEVSVVVVLVVSVTEMTSVTVAVSVACTVTTGGVMVLLALVIGVATVVLRIVSVLVTEVVAGVWRQEHTRAISEAGRDMMLEKTLACAKGASCLLRLWFTAVFVNACLSTPLCHSFRGHYFHDVRSTTDMNIPRTANVY
jgi:hypothetical protein